MADIDTVRRLIGDTEKAAVLENVGQGDGVNNHFQLDMFPLITPATGILTILLTGITALTNTYTVDPDLGTLDFVTGNEPANGASIKANYTYVSINTGDLNDILSGHTGSPYLAASNALLILAADDTRLFMYIMGDKTVDKRKIAKDFRELSKEYENKHFTLRNKVNFDTKIWTMKDNSGTVYDGYDTAVAFLTTSGS